MSESHSGGGATSTGRKCGGKNPPHQCFGCDKEYTRPHKRLVHMRDCCPGKLEECPSCDKGFTNKKGVKCHHARQHGESLSTVDIYCQECGDFYKTVYQSSADSYSVCDSCRSKVKSRRMSGDSNPMAGEGKVIEYECKYCGAHNECLQSSTDRGVFCDATCRDKWLSEHHTGENHRMWNGGKESYYGPNWEAQRQKCLQRDNYKCQSCGLDDEDATISLNAHHIIPFKRFDDRQKANKVDNLVSLCLSCHNKWEGIPIKPELI